MGAIENNPDAYSRAIREAGPSMPSVSVQNNPDAYSRAISGAGPAAMGSSIAQHFGDRKDAAGSNPPMPTGEPTQAELDAAGKPYVGYDNAVGSKRRADKEKLPATGAGAGRGFVNPPVPAGAITKGNDVPNSPIAQGPEAGPIVKDTTGGFTPIRTSNPKSPFDANIAFAHDVARMSAMAGLAPQAQQYMQQWEDGNNKRIGHLADDAIRGLATGNIDKAIALHNHGVPNGTQIVGYKRVDNAGDGRPGWELQYNNGKVERANEASIASMLTQYKDPGYLAKVGLITAKSAETMRLETHKQGLIAGREAMIQGMKASDARNLKMLEDRLGADTVMGISRPTSPTDTGGTIYRTKKGLFHEVPVLDAKGKPAKDFDGTPAMRMVPIALPEYNKLVQSGKYKEEGSGAGAPAASSGGGWKRTEFLSGGQ